MNHGWSSLQRELFTLRLSVTSRTAITSRCFLVALKSSNRHMAVSLLLSSHSRNLDHVSHADQNFAPGLGKLPGCNPVCIQSSKEHGRGYVLGTSIWNLGSWLPCAGIIPLSLVISNTRNVQPTVVEYLKLFLPLLLPTSPDGPDVRTDV